MMDDTPRRRDVVSASRALALALLSLVAGCASPRPAPPSEGAPPSASVPAADRRAAPYRTQAGHLERIGHLRLAAEAWTTAIALAPEHEPSRRALARLRQRIDREVAEHVRRGWQALARDAVGEARRHFLAALALDPESRAAQDALRAVPAPPAPDSDIGWRTDEA
jgi:hypothetical protein